MSKSKKVIGFSEGGWRDSGEYDIEKGQDYYAEIIFEDGSTQKTTEDLIEDLYMKWAHLGLEPTIGTRPYGTTWHFVMPLSWETLNLSMSDYIEWVSVNKPV